MRLLLWCNGAKCYFGIWVCRWTLTLRLFGWLFQVRTGPELFSQRNDKKRIRIGKVSIVLFGE